MASHGSLSFYPNIKTRKFMFLECKFLSARCIVDYVGQYSCSQKGILGYLTKEFLSMAPKYI